MNIHEVPTPALLLDIALFESNLEWMAQHVAQSGKRLRPHAKAHKCVEIAKRQIAAGAVGICTATVAEAELMVGSGLPNVLLTSPVADRAKCARMAALAAQAAVVVDHERQVRWYSEAAADAGLVLDVLVDLDVGDHRTGIAPNDPAVSLARQIACAKGLRFAGLQAYSVHASHTGENVCMDAVQRTRTTIESEGIAVPVVTGGSTGSYGIDWDSPVLTEIQAGSYVLMDLAYRRMDVDFANAMTVIATVISANQRDRVTIDAGFKAFSTDRPFGPEVLDDDVTRYQWAGDEFGYLFPGEGREFRLGDRVRLIPPHCDPTVNLYDRIHVHRGDVVEAVWPIMNRVRAGIP